MPEQRLRGTTITLPVARARAARWLFGATLVVAALAHSAAPARARATIGADRIVVSGDGARATIVRSPFRIELGGAEGLTVLSEVPGGAASGSLPSVVPPLPDQVAASGQTPPPPASYAPLTFTVGAQRSVVAPAEQFAGNLLAEAETGVTYSAQSVLAAAASGAGVRLVVSTNDPSGRTLIVDVLPVGRGLVRVIARPSDPQGVVSMADSFASAPGEAFRGFGGRHNALDQHGQQFVNWVQQENTGAGGLQPVVAPLPTSGGDRYLFPNGPQAAYDVQSQFVSSRGYGFLLARDEISRWRMDSDRPDAWQVSVAAPVLDYVVAPGSAPAAIGDLTALTGRQRVPPTWAAGSLWDREVKYPMDNPTDYAAAVRDDLAQFARNGLPVDGYRLEGWQFLSRPTLRALIASLRARGIHPLLYFRAFVGQDNIGTDDPHEYDTAVNDGYVATTPSGQPYLFVSNFNSLAALIDFTNPAAVAWWKGRIKAALDLGADGFMQDFGEQVQPDMRFHDGSTGAQMHNRYPVLYHAVTREAVSEWERAHAGRRVFFFTRASYSGTPGAAAYEGANFPGDETTDFSRASGLASLTTDMLNRAVGGQYGYSTDIGGYFDLGPYSATTKELFTRWAEWAALSPLFRLHGSVAAGVHTPWMYGPDTARLYVKLAQLHLAARALILRLWADAQRTGIPPTRPLWLQYPGDAQAAVQDQEWMLGPDVLVAPVVDQGASARTVYFPAGCWRAPDNGETHRGPAHSQVAAPLARLPYYFRCGTRPFAAASQRRHARGRHHAVRHRRRRAHRHPRRAARRPRFTG